MTEIYSDIDQLDLCTQTYNALRRGGFHTCAQILRAGRHEVRKLRWIGPAAIDEIATGLAVSQSGEWTEQGAPLPVLIPEAARIVAALGQGDSPAVRQGLVRVLGTAHCLSSLHLLEIIDDLEHGAR